MRIYVNINRGFTLIELIVAIGIIAILLSIVLIAINPARQFAEADNAKRRSDISSLLNAISQYMVDSAGIPPPEITTTVKNIAKSGSDLCNEIIINEKFMTALPADPKAPGPQEITDCSSSYDTGYTVVKDANNRITVASSPTYEELGVHVSVTR